MRLSELEIREFRGIRCLDLEFSPKGILIYGPNGVGKSSILQAIEYLLTGSVERLTGQGTGRQSLEEDLHHKEASPEESQVTGTFSDGDSKIRIQRCVADGELRLLTEGGDESANGDGIPSPIQSLQAAMESKQNVLTREDLLRFIEAADHERSEVLNEILRLDKIDSYRKTLQKSVREFKSNKERAQDDLDETRKRFYDELETEPESILDGPVSAIASDTTALEIVNELRARYDGEALETLEEDDFTDGITEPDQPQAHPLARSTTAGTLSEIVSDMERFTEDVASPYEELADAIETLESRPKLQRDVRAQQLIEQGQRLVNDDPDRCPLCLADWSDRDLKATLDERRENASEAEHRRDHIREATDALEQSFRKLERNIEALVEDLNQDTPVGHDDLAEEITVLKEFTTTLANTRNELTSGDLLEIPHQELDATALEAKLVPSNLDETLRRLTDIATTVDEPHDRMAAYRTLVVANDRYRTYREARATLEKCEQLQTVADEILSEFQSVRERLLDEVLDEILEELTSLIETFSEELIIQDEKYVFESKEKGIRLRMPFHDGEVYRPNLLFSEGQQDIMGLAIFLSMSRVVTKEDVNIILLDDVLTSVDAEHRANVARILDSEYGDEFQFLFTTHDMVWSRHLRRTKHIHSDNVVHLSSWSYYGGVHQHIDITNPRENINHHLRNNDLAAAAAWARKMAEFYTAKGCEHFDVEVRFTDIEKLSLKDYLNGLMPKMSALLRNGKTDDETGLDENDVADLLATFGEMQEFIDQNLWGMNKNIHYSEPETATFTESELRSNIDSFDEVFGLIYCDDCDCWRNETDRGIECECSLLVKT